MACFVCLFFNDTATTEIYTLSLHDALPIWYRRGAGRHGRGSSRCVRGRPRPRQGRSEEHTSELQSRLHLVCRLLLEKKKKQTKRLRPTKPLKNHTHPQPQPPLADPPTASHR